MRRDFLRAWGPASTWRLLNLLDHVSSFLIAPVRIGVACLCGGLGFGGGDHLALPRRLGLGRVLELPCEVLAQLRLVARGHVTQALFLHLLLRRVASVARLYRAVCSPARTQTEIVSLHR